MSVPRLTNPYASMHAMRGCRWYRGALHSHTRTSKRAVDPRDVARAFKRSGFDFTEILDHAAEQPRADYLDTCGVMEESGATFTILKGSEIVLRAETYGACEINSIGYIPRDVPQVATATVIEDIHARGKIAYLCHPEAWNGHPEPVCNDRQLQQLEGLEILNSGRAARSNDGTGGFAVKLWDHCLTRGLRLHGFTGSDWHGGPDRVAIGTPFYAYTMVLAAAMDEDALLKALASGSFYVTTGIELNHVRVDRNIIEIVAWQAGTITFIGRNGRVLKTADGPSASYTADGSEGYVRVELSNDLPAFPGARFNQAAWLQPCFTAH